MPSGVLPDQTPLPGVFLLHPSNKPYRTKRHQHMRVSYTAVQMIQKLRLTKYFAVHV